MTGKILYLWFADTGLLNKSCADRVMAACGVFLVCFFFLPFPELEQFLSQNSSACLCLFYMQDDPVLSGV